MNSARRITRPRTPRAKALPFVIFQAKRTADGRSWVINRATAIRFCGPPDSAEREVANLNKKNTAGADGWFLANYRPKS